MRDPQRIPELCELLQRAWTLEPDMRLGQLVVNAVRPSSPCPGVFYAEDGHTRRGLRQLIARRRGAPEPAPEGLELEWAEQPQPRASTVRLEGAREASFELEVPMEREPSFGEDGEDSEARPMIWTVGTVLELRFVGEYGHGSLGNHDAAAMRDALLPWVARSEPDVVLLDLSGLRYTWGNSIAGLPEAIARFGADEPIRTVILGGPDSLAGLRGLFSRVHETHAEAVAEVVRLAYARCVLIA